MADDNLSKNNKDKITEDETLKEKETSKEDISKNQNSEENLNNSPSSDEDNTNVNENSNLTKEDNNLKENETSKEDISENQNSGENLNNSPSSYEDNTNVSENSNLTKEDNNNLKENETSKENISENQNSEENLNNSPSDNKKYIKVNENNDLTKEEDDIPQLSENTKNKIRNKIKTRKIKNISFLTKIILCFIIIDGVLISFFLAMNKDLPKKIKTYLKNKKEIRILEKNEKKEKKVQQEERAKRKEQRDIEKENEQNKIRELIEKKKKEEKEKPKKRTKDSFLIDYDVELENLSENQLLKDYYKKEFENEVAHISIFPHEESTQESIDKIRYQSLNNLEYLKNKSKMKLFGILEKNNQDSYLVFYPETFVNNSINYLYDLYQDYSITKIENQNLMEKALNKSCVKPVILVSKSCGYLLLEINYFGNKEMDFNEIVFHIDNDSFSKKIVTNKRILKPSTVNESTILMNITKDDKDFYLKDHYKKDTLTTSLIMKIADGNNVVIELKGKNQYNLNFILSDKDKEDIKHALNAYNNIYNFDDFLYDNYYNHTVDDVEGKKH